MEVLTTTNIHPNDSSWFNFYSPQIVDDLNSDGISDLLCANGGDHSLDAFEFDRPPGQLLFLMELTDKYLKELLFLTLTKHICHQL